MESSLASALALDASLWEAQKVGLEGPMVVEATLRRRRLQLEKDLVAQLEEDPDIQDPVKLRDGII